MTVLKQCTCFLKSRKREDLASKQISFLALYWGKYPNLELIRVFSKYSPLLSLFTYSALSSRANSRTFEGKGSVFLKKSNNPSLLIEQNKREMGKNEKKLTKHSDIYSILGKEYLLEAINGS